MPGNINLAQGLNSIEIPVLADELKFFVTGTFRSTDVGETHDMGIQLLRVLVKTETEQHDFDVKSIPMTFDVQTKYDIDDTLSVISMLGGWHELEETKLRWTNGSGVLKVKMKDNNGVLKLLLSSTRKQPLTLIVNNTHAMTLNLLIGSNEVGVGNLQDVDTIELKTDTFVPNESAMAAVDDNDNRKLGVQFLGATIVFWDKPSIIKPIRKIFFEHDGNQLKSFLKKYQFSNENIKTIGGFGDVILDDFAPVKDGKLNLNDQIVFFSHRSGWSYVIDMMQKYHNPDGVKFEGFLERPFIWNKKHLLAGKKLPFTKPWVGILHNPWTFPIDRNESITTAGLVKSDIFQQSLKCCKGLYTLSNELKQQVQAHVNVPVNFLYHPTEFVNKVFSPEEFLNNPHKKIVESGAWLRKTNSLFLLNVDKSKWNKTKILPTLLNQEKNNNQMLFERKKYGIKVSDEQANSVQMIYQLSDDDYDDILQKNIVFVDLYASSANNVIIESIARGTPILINKLSAVVEYLGEDYPMYFSSLEEASDKVNDFNVVIKTHEYLMNLPQRKLITAENFIRDFENSPIYKSL
jgi:hypothetical protein